VIIVQIGTTNSTGPESHEDFTLTRLGVWTLFESEVFGSMDNAGDHDDLSPVGTERTRDPSNRPCTHRIGVVGLFDGRADKKDSAQLLNSLRTGIKTAYKG
jgi:hypothetical protein